MNLHNLLSLYVLFLLYFRLFGLNLVIQFQALFTGPIIFWCNVVQSIRCLTAMGTHLACGVVSGMCPNVVNAGSFSLSLAA